MFILFFVFVLVVTTDYWCISDGCMLGSNSCAIAMKYSFDYCILFSWAMCSGTRNKIVGLVNNLIGCGYC